MDLSLNYSKAVFAFDLFYWSN